MRIGRIVISILLTLALLCGVASAEDLTSVIIDSRTAQSFTDEAVSAEDLSLILEAGLSATSAINQQPWYFAVVTNREVMDEIKGSAGGFGGGAKAGLGDAPVAIIVYMNEATASPNAAFDCGLACENMFIAAKALGYGAKIISSPTMRLNGGDHDALCGKLGVDPSYSAVAVLLVGHEDASTDATSGASVRSDIGEKVSFVK